MIENNIMAYGGYISKTRTSVENKELSNDLLNKRNRKLREIGN